MTYRIPQIKKIYKNKKGDDISKKTFIIHNLSYIFLFLYLVYKKYNIINYIKIDE